MIQEALARLVEGRDLTLEQTIGALDDIIDGRATPAQVGGFLVALRNKGESLDELVGFASTFRKLGLHIHPKVSGRLVDTCGTGGDQIKTFNVSTISALVAAGAGVPIAKHGNRSVTSRCGSADLLEALGFNLSMEPAMVKDSIEQLGIGFMFAPAFHPAMKKVAPVRKELGIRTIFNLMGPLMNPASADAQVLGVYSPALPQIIASVLCRLGTREAMVVHGEGGLDEISINGRTFVTWVKDGKMESGYRVPEDFGVSRRSQEGLEVSSVEESARLTLRILGGEMKSGAAVDMVMVNAAAAIMVGRKAKDVSEAVQIASESLESGAAAKKLEGLVKFSRGDLGKLESYASAQ